MTGVSSRVVGKSSKCWRWRRGHRRSRPPSHWPFRPGGPAPAAIRGRSGGAASAPAPSPTNAPSTTSTSPFDAAAPAASSPASTPSRCCCCGPAARLPKARRRRSHRRGSPSGLPPPRRLPSRQPTDEHGRTGAAAPAVLPPRRHRFHRSSPARPATTASPACRPASPSSTAGSTTASRTGLADPSLASYKTWDGLAARLVDAQVGGLANRVRRLAGLVGAHPDWHSRVLAELGVLHLLATSGRHLGELPVSTGRFRGGDHRLAGPPGRRPGRCSRDRPLGGDGSQRHPRRPHRGATHLAARCCVGRVGDGAVVRRVPAEPRHLVRRRHAGACRPVPLSRLGGVAGADGSAPQRTAAGGAHRRFVDRRSLRPDRPGPRRRAVARAVPAVCRCCADSLGGALVADRLHRLAAARRRRRWSAHCWRAPPVARRP